MFYCLLEKESYVAAPCIYLNRFYYMVFKYMITLSFWSTICFNLYLTLWSHLNTLEVHLRSGTPLLYDLNVSRIFSKNPQHIEQGSNVIVNICPNMTQEKNLLPGLTIKKKKSCCAMYTRAVYNYFFAVGCSVHNSQLFTSLFLYRRTYIHWI